ncbi:creatinine amidohydrolase [Spirochaetia bacterium]|nr:creatinine amidohydrolase [Spirochaetia bacterium]
MYFADLYEDEVPLALKKAPVVFLPVGAAEVHGAHLPLATDTILSGGVAKLVAEKIPGSLIMPEIPYGQVWSLRDFPGSINIENETLASFIADIAKSLDRGGAKKLAVINTHVGNSAAIKDAARMIFGKYDIKFYYFTYPGAEKKIAEVCTTKRPHKTYFHACEIETSYMLYLAPDKVDMRKAIVNYPEFPPDFDNAPSPWSSVLSTAVMGDPTAATMEKGKVIIDEVVDSIVRIISSS